MNTSKKILGGLGMLALVLGVSYFSADIASAYRGNPEVKGPNFSTERHEAMEKAFETNDYTAWVNLMPKQSRITQVINKDNFAKFSEAHNLAEKGDLAGAQKIRQELGLGLKNGQGFNRGNGGNCMNR